MGDRYDIGVDIGEGKDYSVATTFRCWNRDDQERLLDELDPMAHDLGVEAGEYTFSAEVVDIRPHEIIYHLCGLNAEWERISEVLDRTIRSWEECLRLCERLQYRKRRKTTYRTIRRDCAKRNRGR